MLHVHRISAPGRTALAAVGLAAALAGCTAQFTQQPGGGVTPTLLQANIPGVGPVPLDPATAQPLAQAVPPPPNLTPVPGNPLPPPTTALGHDGNYNGWAELLSGGGGGPNCPSRVRVTNFRVKGDRVHFGGFRGRVDAQGGIQIAYGTTWLTGQFTGAEFTGTLAQMPVFSNAQGCTYRMVLDRA
jgi:hypothetical protein